MEQVYIDTLYRMKTEGLAGMVFNHKFQFDIKYENGILYFSKVIDYITKETLIEGPHSVAVSKELLEEKFDILVKAFVEKYIYSCTEL